MGVATGHRAQFCAIIPVQQVLAFVAA